MATSNSTDKESRAFNWQGLDRHGAAVKGVANGTSVAIVRANLRSQGITPLKVRRKSASILTNFRKKKVTAEDICMLTRQLATMTTAGVPLVQSIDIVGRGHDNPSMQELMATIKSKIEAGSSLSEALQDHPRHFDDLYCNLIEAGEQSGALESMLNRLATYKEKAETLKRKIKKALFYPTAIVIVAIIVSVILLIFVVPQFESLFKGFGAELPTFTQMVINLSETLQAYWHVTFAAVAVAGWALAKLHFHNKKFQHLVDRVVLRIPVIGGILHKAIIARYARTLSTTFSAGVPLIEALVSVARATGNVIYRNAVDQVRESVATGQQMHVAMRESGIFPNMVLQMIAIGEESGSLDSMLEKIAVIYEEEVDLAVDGLSSLIEPVIMVILGVLVGGLVVAMYLPIFKMGSVL